MTANNNPSLPSQHSSEIQPPDYLDEIPPDALHELPQDMHEMTQNQGSTEEPPEYFDYIPPQDALNEPPQDLEANANLHLNFEESFHEHDVTDIDYRDLPAQNPPPVDIEEPTNTTPLNPSNDVASHDENQNSLSTEKNEGSSHVGDLTALKLQEHANATFSESNSGFQAKESSNASSEPVMKVANEVANAQDQENNAEAPLASATSKAKATPSWRPLRWMGAILLVGASFMGFNQIKNLHVPVSPIQTMEQRIQTAMPTHEDIQAASKEAIQSLESHAQSSKEVAEKAWFDIGSKGQEVSNAVKIWYNGFKYSNPQPWGSENSWNFSHIKGVNEAHQTSQPQTQNNNDFSPEAGLEKVHQKIKNKHQAIQSQDPLDQKVQEIRDNESGPQNDIVEAPYQQSLRKIKP